MCTSCYNPPPCVSWSRWNLIVNTTCNPHVPTRHMLSDTCLLRRKTTRFTYSPTNAHPHAVLFCVVAYGRIRRQISAHFSAILSTERIRHSTPHHMLLDDNTWLGFNFVYYRVDSVGENIVRVFHPYASVRPEAHNIKYLKGCYRAKLHVTFSVRRDPQDVSSVLTDVQLDETRAQANVYVFTSGVRANALIHHHQSPTSCHFHETSPVTGNSLKSHLYSWQINSKTTSPAPKGCGHGGGI